MLQVLLAVDRKIFGIILRNHSLIVPNDQNSRIKNYFKEGTSILNLYDTKVVQCTKCGITIGEVDCDAESILACCKYCKIEN